MLRSRITDDEVLERPFNYGQLKRLLSYMKPFKKELFITLILMFVAAFAGLLGPRILQTAIDDYMLQQDYGGLTVLSLIFLAVNGISALCMRQRVRTMSQVGQKVLYRIRQDMFNHIQKLSFNFYDSRPAGKILVRIINDVNSLGNLLTNGILNVLVDFATLILIIVLMATMSLRLTMITLIALPFIFIVVFGLKRTIRHRWQTVRKKSSSMNAYLHESLAGMRVTQAYVREPETNRVYRELSQDLRSSWLNASQGQQPDGALHRNHSNCSCSSVGLLVWCGND
jgi:ATP-binding cassette subfamily B multidrug efflux pump